MELKLSADIERKVLEYVGGAYLSPTDVVEEALKAFFAPQKITAEEITELNHHIDLGLAQARSGNVVDGSVALAATRERLMSRHRA